MEQPHGFGTYFDDEGHKMYEGFWRDGSKHGQGIEYDRNENDQVIKTFEGVFEEDQAKEGTLYLPSGEKYVGQLNGTVCRQGEGCLIGPSDAIIYKGQWSQNKPHGKGTFYFTENRLSCCPRGRQYVGAIQNG